MKCLLFSRVKPNWKMLFVLVYLLFPLDLLPDLVPIVGLIDDAIVLLVYLYSNFRRGAKEAHQKIEG